MNPQLKENLTSAGYWLRAFYVLLFIVCTKVAAAIVLLVAIGQIFFTLLTGQANTRLTSLGDSLAQYVFSAYLFICCKTEEKPFPFADWPAVKTVEECVGISASSTVDQNAHPKVSVAESGGDDAKEDTSSRQEGGK